MPARDRDVAMVFQSYALYPTMTVAQNIALPLKMRGLDRKTSDEKVAGVARLLQIEPLLARLPRELSGGQRQRVAIGRALVRDPRLFLFDEPLSNLDAALRTELRAEIKRLHQSIRRTMVYVTHDQTEALTLADKIVVLKAGKIEQTGTPLSLYDDPDNAFVAGFIGTPRMNFLKATVVNDGKALAAGEARVDISHLKTRLANGKTVTLGIRPEHLDEKQGVALSLAVDVTERLGSTSYVHGALPGGETVVAERREDQPRFGETITLRFQPRAPASSTEKVVAFADARPGLHFCGRAGLVRFEAAPDIAIAGDRFRIHTLTYEYSLIFRTCGSLASDVDISNDRSRDRIGHAEVAA
ncbi:ABC transporter ATP-binding protein [Mesorhizobium sp. VK24D]|uniref:ABC transporter ATP-binding protein n=1 Tax=Mesorhizobium album TaxID=3072314 RepID=A0ABU4YAT0_9HYPH|nr:ABC transporter ATP-binding protein [Mesorhizobium sp. VK24D]MDX8483039.1 ABC transporter ATP-binding protein [Mesorhizobium sp. VK24D]